MGRSNTCFSQTALKQLAVTTWVSARGKRNSPNPLKKYLKMGKNSLGAFGAPNASSPEKEPLNQKILSKAFFLAQQLFFAFGLRLQPPARLYLNYLQIGN